MLNRAKMVLEFAHVSTSVSSPNIDFSSQIPLLKSRKKLEISSQFLVFSLTPNDKSLKITPRHHVFTVYQKFFQLSHNCQSLRVSPFHKHLANMPIIQIIDNNSINPSSYFLWIIHESLQIIKHFVVSLGRKPSFIINLLWSSIICQCSSHKTIPKPISTPPLFTNSIHYMTPSTV